MIVATIFLVWTGFLVLCDVETASRKLSRRVDGVVTLVTVDPVIAALPLNLNHICRSFGLIGWLTRQLWKYNNLATIVDI
jgi:hypothetical protein